MVKRSQEIRPLPEVQIVMVMDGWGSPAKKLAPTTRLYTPNLCSLLDLKYFTKTTYVHRAHGSLLLRKFWTSVHSHCLYSTNSRQAVCYTLLMKAEVLRPYFLLFLLVLMFTTVAYIIKPFLGPLVLAAIAAVVLQPVYARVLRGIPGRGLAALCTVFLTSVCIVLPLFSWVHKYLARFVTSRCRLQQPAGIHTCPTL